MQTKNQYIEGSTTQLDLWGDQFAALERRVSALGRAAGLGLRRRLDALRRRKRVLKKRLREAAHEPTADWEEVRPELHAAFGEFRELAIAVHNDLHRRGHKDSSGA